MLQKIGNQFDHYVESKFTLIMVWQIHSWYVLKGSIFYGTYVFIVEMSFIVTRLRRNQDTAYR